MVNSIIVQHADGSIQASIVSCVKNRVHVRSHCGSCGGTCLCSVDDCRSLKARCACEGRSSQIVENLFEHATRSTVSLSLVAHGLAHVVGAR